jgi:hypothetical protein
MNVDGKRDVVNKTFVTLALTLLVFNALDFVLTAYGIHMYGLGLEANPVARFLFSKGELVAGLAKLFIGMFITVTASELYVRGYEKNGYIILIPGNIVFGFAAIWNTTNLLYAYWYR